ncbi:MAG TPA: hypothetical protein VGM43_25800, partial [Bryobacteraceae bacterium]
ILYSSLLPLWGGFDEPFHFGYVEALANNAGFPDPRSSRLSAEEARAIVLAPASPSVQRNLPQVTTFSQYFALPPEERRTRRRELFAIDPALRSNPSRFINYEGLQAPIAYLILSGPERMLAGQPLSFRVLVLRIFCGLSATILLILGTLRLAERLEMPQPWPELLTFCVLSSQMIWATVAHVANDWLAVPLALWLLVLMIDLYERGTMRRAIASATVLALGLLTKAYFLAFIPLFAAVCLLRRRFREASVAAIIVAAAAGPWYYRNIARYGTISGMQELRLGIHPAQALRAVRPGGIIPAIDMFLRQALWTGDNLFRSFSVVTLRLIILACVAGLLLWIGSKHKQREWIIAGYCALFALALGYDAAINFVMSNGETMSPGAWYAQVLVAPLLALVFLGASRLRRIGQVTATAVTLLYGYVLVVTYWEKLIPMYAGIEDRMTLKLLLETYGHAPRLFAALGEVSLGSTAVIAAGAALVTSLAVVQMACFTLQLWRDAEKREAPAAARARLLRR